MDAAALLHRHGWRGKGHSLDANNRGIKKPLLVSSKRDLSGVGQKSKAVRTSDQWWARALDEGLKAVGTGRAVSECDRQFQTCTITQANQVVCRLHFRTSEKRV
jgi:hypothetical protein